MSKEKETTTQPETKKITSNQVPWKRVSRGVEVAPGTDWVTGLSHEQRVQHMLRHEQYWKSKYNAQRGTMQANQSWSRG